jgi:signal transduction histidine kinase
MLSVEVEIMARRAPGAEADLPEHLHALGARISGLSDDVRRIAYQLHPAVLEHLGLAVALKSYCADFSKNEGIKVNFRYRNVSAAIPGEVALCVYRVTQECLRNVARHSGAKVAYVTVMGTNGALGLTISDRGTGFAPELVKVKKGLGLVSVVERARLVDGSLSIKTRPGDGTRIELRIPLPKEGA